MAMPAAARARGPGPEARVDESAAAERVADIKVHCTGGSVSSSAMMNQASGRVLLFHLMLQVSLSFHGLQCQPINSREDPWMPQSLNSITVLPTDVQLSGFITKEKPARYFFLVLKSFRPVTVRVTPCESPIFWRLSFLEVPSESDRGRSHKHAGHAKHLHSMGHDQHQASRTPLEVFSYLGNGEESYHVANSSVGLYRLDVFSMEKDTNYQLFATTNPNSPMPLLKLPQDPQVSVISVKERDVTLAWNPTPGISGSSIEYCVFVNRLHNFKTLCAIEASSYGGTRVKGDWSMNHIHSQKNSLKLTKNTFNSVHSLPNKPKNLYEENEVIGMDPATPLSSTDKGDTKKICVSNQTSVTVSGLRPTTHYYFDVFAMHRVAGTSMAYTGTFAETKAKIMPHTSELRVEEMMYIFLMSRGITILKFPTRALNGLVSLFIHSCLHKAHLQITLGRETVVSKRVEGAQIFNFDVIQESVYTIRLKANHKGPSLIKLFLTSHPQKLPFPSLPTDTGLRVSDHSTSCSSVTVRWTGMWEATKYCIYLRRIEKTLDLRLIKKHQNSCLGPGTRPKNEVVTCRHVQGSDHQRPTREEKIKGLKPGKVYLMDVYLFGRNRYTLKYPSQIVKTQQC